MAKRWWVIALVVALALSLTSCSRKRVTPVQDHSITYCSGEAGASLGDFDVYIIRTANPGIYEMSIIPVSVDEPGDIVNIYMADGQTLQYQLLKGEVVINPEVEINKIFISESDLENYPLLAIVPFEGGVSFLEATAEKDAICELILPGEGTPDGTGIIYTAK